MPKRALLVYPSPMSEMPHSLAMISAIFQEFGYDIRIEESTFKHPLDNDHFMQVAREYNPDIVGVSMLTMQILKVYDLVKQLKRTGFMVIAGGTHVTTCDREAVDHGIDIVVRNEGEATLREILQKIEATKGRLVNLTGVQGVTYRNILNNEIIRNPDRPRIADLATLPDPDFSAFDIELFRLEGDGLLKGIHRIYTSRGCPGKCLAGDTIIHTIDGDYCISELIGKEDVKVLTRDPITKQPLYAEAKHIRKTQEKADIVRVSFDDGSYIDCTPDHRFKVFKSRNQYIEESEWDVEAKDLCPKQQVRAAYFEIDNRGGRTSIYTQRDIWRPRARMVFEAVNGVQLKDGEKIHHKDGNPGNDSPANLILTTSKNHIRDCHPEISARMKLNNPTKKMTPEWRVKISKGLRGLNRSLETRKRLRDSKLGVKNPRYNPNVIHQYHPSRISSVPCINHKIIKVERLEQKVDVYCMEIPGIYWFYANKVLVHNCTFCDSKVYGQKATFNPIPQVIKDIQRRVDMYGVRKFIVADDCFTMRKSHVAEFCKAVKTINPRVEWQAWTRADMMTSGMADMMKDAGCYMVIFGIESGDPETLKRTCKGTTREKNVAAVKIAHAAGMQVGVNLMFGFPWETVRSLDNTLSMIHELWDYTHMFNGSGSIVPFPGTELYRQYVNEYGFKDYWLNPRYQDCGVSLYQNALNPYAVSTLSQRYMYDDTYIQEGYFFKYEPDFLKKMSEVSYEIGRHNLETMYPGHRWKQKAIVAACHLSKAIYQVFPNLEKRLGSVFFGQKKRPAIEDRRNVARGQVNQTVCA